MGKVVAITGAFGGLGVHVARRFARGDWSVALIGRSTQVEDDVRREFAAHLLLTGVDVANLTSAAGAVDAIVQRFGGLDALVNVAGGFRWETLKDGDVATWDAMYQINVRTAATMCKAALDALIRRGGASIINVGAASALRATSGMGPYTASKAGVMRLTEALADELKQQGVTVNAILPSIIDTEQNRREMPDADVSRWVKPESLAEVIYFLASDAARDLTGALIPVTGRV